MLNFLPLVILGIITFCIVRYTVIEELKKW